MDDHGTEGSFPAENPSDGHVSNVPHVWAVGAESSFPAPEGTIEGMAGFIERVGCGTTHPTGNRPGNRINAIRDAELTDGLEPRSFFGRVSLVDESFKVRLVGPGEVEGGSS